MAAASLKQQSRTIGHTSRRYQAIGASLWLSLGPTKLNSLSVTLTEAGTGGVQGHTQLEFFNN
jgi:hypothetical protein